MHGLRVTDAMLHETGYMNVPVENYTPSVQDVAIFDQNGYDMCPVELEFAKANRFIHSNHRSSHIALRQDWMKHADVRIGAHFNHCNLFERKGYIEEAREQLQSWVVDNAMIWKIIKIRPKWGLDFSIDYADDHGNVFEVIHWEWDSFNYDEVVEKRNKYEPLLLSTDWDDAAKQLLKRKDEWYSLGFFEQSDYKCNFFGIEPEQFKMVLWE